MRLHARIDIGEGADRAGDCAGGDFGARGQQAGAAAVELGIGFRHLQAEGHRLGVDAMRAADADRVLVLMGAALEGGQQRVDVGQQQVGGAGELHVEAGVQDVRGRHALMHEARVRPDDFRQMGEEGDDVVLGLALDLVDAGNVEGGLATLVPDGPGGFLRDHAEVRQGVAGVCLDLEPDTELGLGRPDVDHLGPGIARDHGNSVSGGDYRRRGVRDKVTCQTVTRLKSPAVRFPPKKRHGPAIIPPWTTPTGPRTRLPCPWSTPDRRAVPASR